MMMMDTWLLFANAQMEAVTQLEDTILSCAHKVQLGELDRVGASWMAITDNIGWNFTIFLVETSA